MNLFAETERLTLRALEESELPRLVELIGDWDVVRWLMTVPFPYTMRNAEEFYADMMLSYSDDAPEFYTMALKSDNLLIGGVGLHSPRTPNPLKGEIEIGYWLGKDFWGRGLMSEATRIVIDLGFARPSTQAIGAVTAPDNKASQNVLRKAGLRDLGIMPRAYDALRGGNEIRRWLLTRQEYEQDRLA